MNTPMSQFQVILGFLTIVDNSKWDYFLGFRRVIKEIENETS